MSEFLHQLEISVNPGQEYKLKPLVMATCMNMFSHYMCSIRFGYEDDEFREIVRYFDEIFWEINQGYAIDFLPFLLPFYRNHMKKLETWSKDIRSFILSRIIDDRERDLDPEEPEKDFTDALLHSLREDSTVNRETIIYMLEDFLGGHSAIGNLVMLALANAVRNPEVACKIQQEIDQVTDFNTRSITLYDTEKMPYTVSAISETLRYSSSPIVPHVATENTSIAGYAVEKGTIVFINNYELNTSDIYWNKPEQFDPERFLEPVPEDTKKQDFHNQDFHNQDSGLESDSDILDDANKPKMRVKKNIPHFLPFSIGKRTCIGQSLVRGFSFVMFATIMQHYNVSTSDVKNIKTYPASVAVPPDTFSLILEPRIRE